MRAAVLPLLLLAAVLAVAPGGDPGAGEDGEEGVCHAGDDSCRTVSTAFVDGGESLQWKPQTLSVVLPCAGEGKFARRTVESVSDSVPGGSGGDILANIVVVDDGSQPPLSQQHLPKKFLEQYKVTLLRNKKTVGLIKAKSQGARGATGDVIVFFDCHVAPQPGWYEEFLQSIAENYRRVVVPQITDLDIDTWEERNRHSSTSKCYLTWDADFKWFTSAKSDIPVLSGGLLGISRRWWNETGGYDEGMRGWGGENVDQSLRTWLCGGEIKSLSHAFVAHMWRVPHDKRTAQKYSVNVMHVLQNRVRAAMGWFDDFVEKLDHYPDMGFVQKGSVDVSALHAVRDRLRCRPFAWFLWRFRDVYEDAGLLPNRTFRIRHIPTKKCLTYVGPAGTHPHGAGEVELKRCGKAGRNKGWPSSPPDPQRWHRSNQDPGTGRCCSGLRVWSTDQCLLWQTGKGLVSSVCDVAGRQGSAIVVTGDGPLAPGQLQLGGGCLVVAKGKPKLGECAPQGEETAPAWEEADPSEPLETRLYRKAKEERPEIFRDGGL